MKKLIFEKWHSEENLESRSITLKRNDNKSFNISFQCNLDLYFSFFSNSLKTQDNDFTFLIGKDNYEVWEIFDKLYNNVINANLYSLTEERRERIIMDSLMLDEDYHQNLKYEEEMIKEFNQDLKKRYAYKMLVNKGIITWISDDYYDDIAPFFKIEKVGVSYLISFGIPKVSRKLNSEEIHIVSAYKYLKTISVRIRNSGSRYDPFNIAFMSAFNSLMNLEENNQIHMEEYLIEKELEQGGSLERILKKENK